MSQYTPSSIIILKNEGQVYKIGTMGKGTSGMGEDEWRR
jgi:hypothetical protein